MWELLWTAVRIVVAYHWLCGALHLVKSFVVYLVLPLFRQFDFAPYAQRWTGTWRRFTLRVDVDASL